MPGTDEVPDAAGAAPVKRRRDAVATRQALLDATRRLIGERGVEGTSTRDIAALAGVNQTLVYRYFGSKDKIVAEAASAGGFETVDLGASALDEVARALFDDMLERSAAAADRDGVAFWSLFGSANDEVVRDVVRENIERIARGLGPRLDGPDVAVRAELFLALLTGIAFLRSKVGSHALVRADAQTLASYVDRVAEVLLVDGSAS